MKFGFPKTSQWQSTEYAVFGLSFRNLQLKLIGMKRDGRFECVSGSPVEPFRRIALFRLGIGPRIFVTDVEDKDGEMEDETRTEGQTHLFNGVVSKRNNAYP